MAVFFLCCILTLYTNQCLKSLKLCNFLISSQTPQHSKYKTYMCRDMKQKGGCPRGASCTFAHSQEELEK